MSTKIVVTLVCTRCSRGSEVEIPVDDVHDFPQLWACVNCHATLFERGRRLAVALAGAAV